MGLLAPPIAAVFSATRAEQISVRDRSKNRPLRWPQVTQHAPLDLLAEAENLRTRSRGLLDKAETEKKCASQLKHSPVR
jgi:hypothetical protein